MKLMSIKYLIGSLLLAGSYGMVLTSCSDELTLKDPTINLGSKVRGVVTVPLNVPIAGSGTRTVDFDPNAVLKIDSYWIGIYDTYTGELLGDTINTKPRKDDDSRFTFNGISSNFEVNNVDIYYYDNHPEAFVVGVVNFNNVKAKNAGTDEELTDLEDLLKNAKDWDAFCSISIDAKSAESANPNESDGFGKIPLMMGYYTTGFNGSHPTVKGWDNNKVDQSNVKTVFSEGSSGNVALPAGAIKLMRLVSQVTVHVGGPSIMGDLQGRSTRASLIPLPTPVYPGNEDYIKIKNLQYKVVNNPKSFYLAERATDTEGSKISSGKADYDKRSANSADYDGEDGYSETGWISANGNTFTYQQFENKHWGNGSWFDMRDLVLPTEDIDDEDFDYINKEIWTQQNGVFFIREKKFTDTNVFKTLCPSENVTYNNNAPYIIIKADVEFNYPDDFYSNREESGSIEFMIHEGFIADANGNVIPMPNYNGNESQYMNELINFTQHAVNDYQRYRNTKYDYYIGIAGLQQIMMKVYLSQFGEQMGFDTDAIYDDGINGKLNDVSKYTIDGNGTIEKYYNMSKLAAYPLLPYGYGSSSEAEFFEVFWYAYHNRKDLKWVYSVNDPTSSRKYGEWLAQDNNIGGLPDFGGYVDKNIPDELLNSVKIIVSDNEDPGEFTYPEGSEYMIPGKKVYEWNLKEFSETDVELNYEDFIYNNNVDPKYVVLVYISQLEAGPDVDFKMLDMVYRDFYFKVPLFKDKYATTTYDGYFSIHQTPLDNRTEIYQYPSLDIRDYTHHYYHSYSGYWTTAPNLVNYLCWNWSYGDVKAEYFILKVGDDDEIIVRTDEYGDPYNNYEIHYPYHVSSELAAGYNRISIRPMGLKNPDGTPSNYKMTSPAVFDQVFFVQREPYWVFNSSSVFASAFPSDGNTYRGTVERYGMTIHGSTSSSGLIPYLGSGYIQTGGSGGINQRSFNIFVDRPGKLVVNACKTGSGERGFYMRERDMTSNDYNSAPVYVSVDRNIGDPADFEIQTSYITGPTELILYPSGNLNIYSIRFVPN